jgi:two-component system, LytTR family, response regulator LytT
MHKIVILEDEEPALKRLFKLVKELLPDVQLMASLSTVAEAKQWFEENETPDLVFSDIQLSDGVSFEIFKHLKPSFPVIFVTAFDQYAIEAFKVNSIDYLLKPVKKEELSVAIEKFERTRTPVLPSFDKLLEAYSSQGHAYKKRFVIKYGEHIKTISVEEIAYFYTEDKVNFLVTFEGRRFAIDFNLDNLENLLNPAIFFRINRQFIISITSISEMFAYTKSRVLIKLSPPTKHETVVSTERSASFKSWLGDNK